jgi:glycosyltransferase involved in cell wall biosynthesis
VCDRLERTWKNKPVTEPSAPEPASIAVAIPCYNEAAALPVVIAAWREALPQAEIVVFDNNSTDSSAEIARGLGARVVPVREQGKGNVVRTIFATFARHDFVVLVDGDGTYPADRVHSLLAPILADEADMAVGGRKPVDQPGAMTPVRGLGNLLIRAGFNLLIGQGLGDLLSGYRVFNRRFRQAVTLRSSGFEIETELSSQALVRGLRVVEVAVPYYPRIAGTQSKLRAFRDGLRILRTIFSQSLRHSYRIPLATFLALLIVFAPYVAMVPVTFRLLAYFVVVLALVLCERLAKR